MAQILADKRDIDFVLYEQLDVETLTQEDTFKELNKKMFDMVISEARKLSINELLPTNAIGDSMGVNFENGKVTVPECFHRAHRLLLDGEWPAMTERPENGGQGLPGVVGFAAMEYLYGGNYCLVNYPFMGHGTSQMIDLFGTKEQKSMFLHKLYTGAWGGTMLLTEAGAGSDVGSLTTSAVKNSDGTYSITGNKIFITNGDHDLTENIVHPVLARVEGAAPGTRGISIFIVPKIWVNPDGSLGEPNDILCTGIEEKMGIHGSATCTMALGSRGTCRGLLLGEENQGMRIMFFMMNEARLKVGFQAFTYASSAYIYAANYAKERIQGKDLTAGKDGKDVAIIAHPDVRRMLLWMKAHVDGMRSLVYYVASLIDWVGAQPDSPLTEKRKNLIDFFIPIVKAYCSQRGFDVCVQAVQVYGGYGYIKEYPVEQLVRDCKITSLYEGTDGIQAMDLLSRKMTMNKGALFSDFIDEVKTTVAEAKLLTSLVTHSKRVLTAIDELETIAGWLLAVLDGGKIKSAFAFATPFLDVTGDVVMAWMLLKRAVIATKALSSGKVKGKDRDFYYGQVKTAEFFICTVLPGTLGKMDAIALGNEAVIDIPDTCFGG
jgi:alkylation response protein AidB-like acyl-CoA dehydrogenase